jgi:YVTN family beta-propeller protein
MPVGIAYDPRNGYVYTGDTETSSVSVVDPATDHVLYTVLVGSGFPLTRAEDVLYDPLDGNVYVTYLDSQGNGYLALLNTTSESLQRIWSLPSPGSVLVSSGADFPIPAEALVPENDTLYVALGQVLDAVNLGLQRVTGTISVVPSNVTGGYLTAVTYDSGDGNLYASFTNASFGASNNTTNAVAQIDPLSLGVTAYLPAGLLPDGLVYDPSSGELLVANGGSANVTAYATVVLGGITYQPVSTIPVGGIPVGMAYDPVSQEVYLANAGLGALQNLSGKSNTLLGTLPGLEGAAELAFTPSGTTVYVANARYLTSVDTTQSRVTSRVPLGFYVNGLAYVPQIGNLYASSGGGPSRPLDTIDPQNLSVINETPFAPPDVTPTYASNITAMVFDPMGPCLVALEGANVTAFALPSLVPGKPIPFPDFLTAAAFDPQDGLLYLASYDRNITVVNATSFSFVAHLTVGNANDSLTAIGVDPARELLYVGIDNLTSGGANVSVYNTTTLTQFAKVPVRGIPDGFAVDETNGTLFVATSGTDNVTALADQGKGSYAVFVVDVGMPTGSVLYDPQNDLVYAAGLRQPFLATIRAGPMKPAGLYALGGDPGTMTLDTTDEYLFVWTHFPNSSVEALSVGPNPLALSAFSATPNPVVVGTGTTFVSTPVGGTLPLNFSYSGLPTGCASTDANLVKCTPAIVGNFSVRVTVRDVTGGSVSAVLALDVVWPPPPAIGAFYATPSPAYVDQPTDLSVLATGGEGVLTYSYSGLPSPAATCPDLNATLLTCLPLESGVFQVTVTVTDQAGRSVRGSLTLPVECLGPAAGPHICDVGSSPDPVTLGNQTVLTVNASGGTGPLTYEYSRLPPSAASCPDLNQSRLPCIPLVAGEYSVLVSVTDRNGTAVTASVPLDVNCAGVSPGPRICSFLASPDQFPVGSNTTVSTLVNDSAGPLTYRYAGMPASWAGCTGGNLSSFPCLPSTSGLYTLRVTVKDTKGRQATATLPLFVGCAGEPPGPVVCSTSVDPFPATVGSPMTLSVTANGSGHKLNYAYRDLPLGCAATDLPSLTCSPSAPGGFLVEVVVSDASGHAAYVNLTVLVLSQGARTVTPGASFPWLDVLLAVASGIGLGVLVVAVVALLRNKVRRGKKERPSRAGDSPSAHQAKVPATDGSVLTPFSEFPKKDPPTVEKWKVTPPP